MSANRDLEFPIHYYFGNAAKDLSHLMPIEDEIEAAVQEASTEANIEYRLNQIDSILEKLTEAHEQISFYLRDIVRVTH
jgi:hypothetical protein